MSDHIRITDVSLRDGLQNQPHILPTAQKIALLKALRAARIGHFEVTSFVSPKHVPQLADAAEVLQALPPDVANRCLSLVPNQRGYVRARAAGASGIAVVLSATEQMNRRNINMSLAEATSVSEAIIRQAKLDGVFARAYIAVAFECPFEGPTPPGVVMDLSARMAAAGVDEIAIADTIGAANPRQVREVYGHAVTEFGAARIASHLHDTRGLGSVLAWAAADAGVRNFDAAIAGLGGCPFAPGASGNVAIEDLVYMFNASGMDTGIDFDRLMDAVDLARTLLPSAPGGHVARWASGRRKA